MPSYELTYRGVQLGFTFTKVSSLEVTDRDRLSRISALVISAISNDECKLSDIHVVDKKLASTNVIELGTLVEYLRSIAVNIPDNDPDLKE